MKRKQDDLSRLDGSNPPFWLKALVFLLSAGIAFGLFYLIQLLFK